MTHYSIFSLLRNAMGYHQDWQQAWRSPDPKPEYDVLVIGGGGHGLATAYYLAKEHGITNVAVIEKGWLGGGNTGRNTTIIRSNYLWDESAHLYEKSLQLYEGMSQDLNYNIMLSQRGVLNLAHSLGDVRDTKRRVYANKLNGIDSEYIGPEEIRELVPIINLDPNIRYPVLGSSLQRRGGTARHDAVAWGLARAADARGVDIIQNCEVTGFDIQNGQVKGVHTTRGDIKAKKVGVVVAGHCSVLSEMAGFRMPIESHPLQAMVSDPVKPIIDVVVMSEGDTLGHLIRVVAVCMKDGEKSLREILRKKKGGNKLVEIIKAAGDLAKNRKLKKNKEMSNLVGNAMKTLIPCVQDVKDPIIEEMANMGLIENVIEVLKGCGDGPTRKNTAIVLARLCRHPKLNEKIRQLRGVEILMTLGKELGL